MKLVLSQNPLWKTVLHICCKTCNYVIKHELYDSLVLLNSKVEILIALIWLFLITMTMRQWEESFRHSKNILTLPDGIFETGAYEVPSKSQNPIVLDQDGPSSTQSSNPSWACSWHHPFGTNNYPPFRHSTQNVEFVKVCDEQLRQTGPFYWFWNLEWWKISFTWQ